ncbi:carbohydrate ABC transporter permease [Clostridium sp. chh4-2]|nr:carbohydrate ABC transporter permease [Clostridium sp. chh4-2]
MHSKSTRTLVSKVIIYLFIAIVMVLVMFPLVYTFFGSFKSNAELLTNAHKVLPEKFQTSNYANAWKSANFAQYTWNSLAMAVPIVIGTIFSLTTAAYVFERGHFPGKKLLFLIITSSMFISLGSLTLYPLFKIAKFFSINKSLWGVVIIRVLGINVTNLYVAKSYINSISTEIDDAAKIDGCSFFSIFTRIIFPLCKPLIATLGILEFRFAWNDYLLPMVFTMSNKARMPLVVGIIGLKASEEAASSWTLMLAGTTISLIPIIVVYIFFNRLFIDGLTSGAVKG